MKNLPHFNGIAVKKKELGHSFSNPNDFSNQINIIYKNTHTLTSFFNEVILIMTGVGQSIEQKWEMRVENIQENFNDVHFLGKTRVH